MMIASANYFIRYALPQTLALLLFGCNSIPSNETIPVTTHSYFEKTEQAPVAHWSYEGNTGPAYWGKLHPSYSVAITGKQQSPINIDTTLTVPEKLEPLRFAYRVEQIASFNNGHTIQHNQQAGSFLWIGEERYALEQFHVHTPSEHTVDGRQFPMEIHFVHKSAQGEVLVVAVLVEANEQGKVDMPAYYSLPSHVNEETRYTGQHNPLDFLPPSHAYFEYKGSFTTPPCSEGVRWIVLQQPIQTPQRVIQRFRDILQANNRPLQPLHGREIAESNENGKPKAKIGE
jgi:carbonic anhydrase